MNMSKGVETTVGCILNLDIKFGLIVSFTLRPLYRRMTGPCTVWISRWMDLDAMTETIALA
jgi:hypothetical protein